MRHRRLLAATSFATGLIALSPSSARAQDPAPPPKVADDAGGPAVKGKTEAVGKPLEAAKRPEGWTPGIALGGTFNLVDTRSVVGQQDGTTITLGAALDAVLEFNKEIHEWRTTLVASAGVTRTPSVEEFIKTSDALRFESIYLAHLLEIFGPYARIAMNTTMFPGTDIRPAAVTYNVLNLDGTTTELIGRRLALTDPFEPFTFREGVGVFIQPLNQDEIKLEGRAGVGAQQTLAAGNLAVADDSATAIVEVQELDDFWVVGAEAVVNAWGFIDDTKRVSYAVGAGVLVPFATSDLREGDDRSLIELTSFEGHVGLNVKLFDWASLGYKLSVLREPLLIDEWQVSNNLLLTIGAAFGSKAPVPPAPPPCDCAKDCQVPPAPAPAPAPAPGAAPAPATPTPVPVNAAEVKEEGNPPPGNPAPPPAPPVPAP